MSRFPLSARLLAFPFSATPHQVPAHSVPKMSNLDKPGSKLSKRPILTRKRGDGSCCLSLARRVSMGGSYGFAGIDHHASFCLRDLRKVRGLRSATLDQRFGSTFWPVRDPFRRQTCEYGSIGILKTRLRLRVETIFFKEKIVEK